MDIILYTINDSDNTINKTLVDGLTVPINLKRSVNIVSPSIILADVLGVDLTAYNYASIPALGRFYFIETIQNVNGRIFSLEMACDVLETYKADILAARARFTRNIKNGDYYDTTIDMSVIKSVSQHESDVTAFVGESTIILTSLGA